MRKEIDYTIDVEGRDKGKIFHITEMSAPKAENWARNMLRCGVISGLNINEDVLASGIQGLAIIGMTALLRAHNDDIEPLLIEMMACVTIRPDPKNPNVERKLVENDIEEVRTIVTLRAEVFKLHTGFSLSGLPSTST